MIIRSFDVIIGMDWLSSHLAEIMCYEKAVHLTLTGVKTLTIYSDKPNQNLNLMSCTKARKYLQKKYYAFLAHVVDKKSKMKELKDIPHVCDYPDIFP